MGEMETDNDSLIHRCHRRRHTRRRVQAVRRKKCCWRGQRELNLITEPRVEAVGSRKGGAPGGWRRSLRGLGLGGGVVYHQLILKAFYFGNGVVFLMFICVSVAGLQPR